MILTRDRVAAQAVRLAGLEGRQQNLTAQVLAQRDQLDAAKLTLLNQQMSVTQARDKNVSQLTTARRQVASLRRQLAQLQAEQAQQAAQAAASQTAPGGVGAVDASGNRSGSDPIPGFTIGRDDMGVDATAPPGTGIYAPLASTLVQVLQDWYTSEPLLLFQFDNPPPGALPDYWYVAEQIDPVTTAVGTTFQAGQRVASFAARPASRSDGGRPPRTRAPWQERRIPRPPTRRPARPPAGASPSRAPLESTSRGSLSWKGGWRALPGEVRSEPQPWHPRRRSPSRRARRRS